jgi:hypothetical protein
MDTKGFVDTLKHYGSNGCDVVGNGTTTTIVGDEGQITLEKLRQDYSVLVGNEGQVTLEKQRQEYDVIVVDASDTVAVYADENGQKRLPNLNDEKDVRGFICDMIGSDLLCDMFDGDIFDKYEPRKNAHESFYDDCREIVKENRRNGFSWRSVSELDGSVYDETELDESECSVFDLMDAKRKFNYFKLKHDLDFGDTRDRIKNGETFESGGIIMFKGEDENGGEGCWGAVYDGSRIVPLTKRLAADYTYCDIFAIVNNIKKLDDVEIETRFGGWIKKNPVLYERAKHIIGCLEGPKSEEDFSFVKGFEDGRVNIDFGRELYFEKAVGVVELAANMVGCWVDLRQIRYDYPISLAIYEHGGSKPITSSTLDNIFDSRTSLSFSFNKYVGNNEKVKRFLYTIRKEAERLYPKESETSVGTGAASAGSEAA